MRLLWLKLPVVTNMSKYLSENFFARDPQVVARALLGKVLKIKYQQCFLYAQIIETEAYYIHDKGSHASLGFTEKRKALFMAPGTIYMYYARGNDSLNFSCLGDGNAVLIKSGIPYLNGEDYSGMIRQMQALNPHPAGGIRPANRLCSGQTLLCRSLGLKVSDWNQKTMDKERFSLMDCGYVPATIIQTTRLGIPKGRDEHLPYRFVDHLYAPHCSSNPLTKRYASAGKTYHLLPHPFPPITE